MPARGGTWKGGKWCWPVTRLAVYLRDGLACVWCGETAEDGASLTLDHLTPASRGGSNGATNLVTACKRCNDTRGAESVHEWAARHGKDGRKIRLNARRSLVRHRERARALLANRKSVAEYLAARNTPPSPKPTPADPPAPENTVRGYEGGYGLRDCEVCR